MKKFLSILLAAMMLLATAGVAFAEGEGETTTQPTTYSITLPGIRDTNPSYDQDDAPIEHTYYIYQIFKGTLVNGELTEIVWGANGVGTEGANVPAATLKSLQDVNADGKTDEDKLAVINTIVNLDEENAFASGKSGETVDKLPAGYYLVKDENDSLTAANEAYTTYIVKLVNTVEITAKSVMPSVDKQVYDDAENDDDTLTNGWFETADHELFEEFKFKLTANLPAGDYYEGYETYKIVFNDTMSEGLTFVRVDSVTVQYGNGEAQPLTETTDYTHTGAAANKEWSLTVTDLLKNDATLANGAIVTVEYTAYLNENAYITEVNGTNTTNKNTVSLEFSNNPNWDGTGEEKLGETPEDHVWVFTYTASYTKYQNSVADANKMSGAGFTLYYGNAVDESKKVQVYKVSNGVYQVVKEGNKVPDGKDIITEMFAAEDDPETTDVNEAGPFVIKGLDAGTYLMEETTVPDNFNKCANLEIVIAAAHSEVNGGQSAIVDMTGTDNVNENIVNKTGAELPETGGIGTTLFYLIGGLMAAGSALTLVIRRRADADEE